ncbi:hypothetical protein FQN53_009327 [Emmonsiellopsis sp. PD_33]|nr:hypothetical protein FQN53_009327 [Emmonsiellopsis sp. PD_33]
MDPRGEATPTAPEVKVIYSAPGFKVLHPNVVKEKTSTAEPIFNWGGVRIAKISPDIVVKHGTHVRVTEANSMLFVSQNTTTVPVPKIFGCYTYGPIDRDIDDYGSLYDTYIFMSFVEGQTLDTVWESYDGMTKQSVADQLKGYIDELRAIGGGTYIGSVDRGFVMDPVLEYSKNRGPFDSEEDFNNALIDAYEANAKRVHIRTFLTGMLSQNQHQTVFTHGDLRLQNILVKDGKVTGIVDWEFSGWYPEYWEWARALFVWQWQHDWTDYLPKVLQPYYLECMFHSFIAHAVW